MEQKELINKFIKYLKFYHRLDLKEVEITDSRGYWRIIKECKGECREGHRQPINHTIYYVDGGRDSKGRFETPYKTWKLIKSMDNKRGQ